MKAYAIDGYKAPLTLHDLPEPVVGPGDVLVDLAASSVNPLDYKLKLGALKAVLPYKMPLTLGHDLAGTVAAVGKEVRGFRVGEPVFAYTGRPGTFAERVAVPENELARAPSNIELGLAAAIPLVAITSWRVLVERANIQPGQRVLILAGSGGVGTIAIQLAKHLGAHVATTVGTANLALAKELGADVAIDYHTEAFELKLSGYDVVLHSLGRDELMKSLLVLKPGGKLISISGPPDPAFARHIGANWIIRLLIRLASLSIRRRAKKRGVEYSFMMMPPDGVVLGEIAALVEAGKLRPIIDREFAFSETAAALDHSASGRARGKIVIRNAGALALPG